MERRLGEGTKKLGVLDYMDRQTVRIYDETLKKVRNAEVKAGLERFRADHASLADQLDAVAKRMGWRREEPSEAFRAFFSEHTRIVQNARDENEALEGLLLIEQANLGECRRTLSAGPPLGAADIVKQMCNFEVRDVDFLARHVLPMTGLSAVTHDAHSGKGAWDMSPEELHVMLSGLRSMDEQSANAYDAAIPKAGSDEVAGQLQAFRDDHKRHAQAIDNVLEKMGKSAELATGELQQYLSEAVGLISRAKDQDEALERMLLLERANSAEYESVSRANIPNDEAMRLVEQHHLDEQHHVAWVELHTPISVGYSSQSAPRVGEDPTSTPGL
ncbi:MAG TPA: ferritin-like domain-containing protein [Coriobacteriia bacterium]|jgi:rubrerythrin